MRRLLPRLVVLALLVCAAPAHAQVFVSDTMTGSTGTTLASHTGGIGATWTCVFGCPNEMLLTDANRLRANNDDVTVYSASGVPASADYDVACPIRRVSNLNYIGCGGRASATATSAIGYYCTLGSGNLYLHLLNAGGGITELGSYSASLADTTDYAVVTSMRGTTIKCLLDGVERISVTDATLTSAGRVAVWAYYPSANATGHHIDSVTGTNPPSGAMSILLTGVTGQ